jgi:hypothetical protein
MSPHVPQEKTTYHPLDLVPIEALKLEGLPPVAEQDGHGLFSLRSKDSERLTRLY